VESKFVSQWKVLELLSEMRLGEYLGVNLPAKTLWVYVDESGNFDFSASGTKHFVMSAFFTTDPLQTAGKIASLKYSLLSQGVNVANFHASEDSQRVRDQVFDHIFGLKRVSGYTFWLKKGHLPVELKNTSAIYELLGLELARTTVNEANTRKVTSIVMVFDRTLRNREEQAFRSKSKAIFTRLRYPFHIYFHNVSKDFNGQIADYVAWANYVRLERDEQRPLDALPKNLRSASEVASMYLKKVIPSTTK